MFGVIWSYIRLLAHYAPARGPLQELCCLNHVRCYKAFGPLAEVVHRVMVRAEKNQVVRAVVQAVGDSPDVRNFAVIRIPADRAAVMGFGVDYRS